MKSDDDHDSVAVLFSGFHLVEEIWNTHPEAVILNQSPVLGVAGVCAAGKLIQVLGYVAAHAGLLASDEPGRIGIIHMVFSVALEERSDFDAECPVGATLLGRGERILVARVVGHYVAPMDELDGALGAAGVLTPFLAVEGALHRLAVAPPVGKSILPEAIGYGCGAVRADWQLHVGRRNIGQRASSALIVLLGEMSVTAHVTRHSPFRVGLCGCRPGVRDVQMVLDLSEILFVDSGSVGVGDRPLSQIVRVTEPLSS